MDKTLIYITALTIDSKSIMVQTNQGHFLMSWDAITHAFIVKIGNRPVFIMQYKKDDNEKFNLAIDSLKIDDIKMMINGKIFMSFITRKMLGGFSKTFVDLLPKITANFSWTYIDQPLAAFMENPGYSIPELQDEASVYDYIAKIVQPKLKENPADLLERSIQEIQAFSTPVSTREEWEIGTVIDGRYEITNILTGGMGIVYIVNDSEKSKPYAIKTFQEKYLYTPQVCSQFITEAEIWIKLGRHKNIVQAERIIQKEGRPYIFLEYIDGMELEKKLKDARLSVHDAIDYAIQFCEGMSYAFDRMKLVHRDIKPANCFIDKSNTLKITDFGLGKIAYPSGQQAAGGTVSMNKDVLASAAMVGTVPYMAPELFSDMSKASVQSDIYAFGIMFYEMLTGENPFLNEDPLEVIDRHLTLVPENPSTKNPEVPETLDLLVMRCLAKDPQARYTNFGEILNTLTELYKQHTGQEFDVQQENSSLFNEEDWIKTGLSFANLRNFTEAIKAYDEALKLNPRSPAMLHKGNAYLESGKFKESLTIFKNFTELHPDYWKGWLLKADALRQLKQYSYAIEALQTAENLKSGNAELIAKKAQIKAEIGALSEAVELYEQALESDSTIPEIWFNYGNHLSDMGQYDNALDSFNEAIALNPRYLGALQKKGEMLTKLGFLQEAIKTFNLCLSIAPAYPEALGGLGECYLQLGNTKKATEYYSSVLKHSSPPQQAIIGKLKVLQLSGRGEAAETFISAYPEMLKSTVVKEIMTEINLSLHRYTKAIEFGTVVANTSEDTELLHLLKSCAIYRESMVREFKKDLISEENTKITLDLTLNDLLTSTCSIDEAKRYINTIYKKIPEQKLRYFYLMTFLEKISGNDAKAEKYYSFLQESNPKSQKTKDLENRLFPKKIGGVSAMLGLKKRKKDATDHLISGLTAFCAGNYSVAVDELQTACLADNDMGSALYFTAQALNLLGEKHKARSLFEDFIQRHPKSFGYYMQQIISDDGTINQESMEQSLIKMTSLTPFIKESWLYLLNFYIRTGQKAKLETTAGILKKFALKLLIGEEKRSLFLLKGALELILNRPLSARVIFEQLYADNRNNASVACMLAYSMLESKEPEAAEKTLNNFTSTMTDEEKSFYRYVKAKTAVALNKEDSAIKILEEAGEDIAAMTQSLEIYLDANRLDEAEEKFKSLNEIAGDETSTIMLGQELAIKQGKPFTIDMENVTNSFLMKAKELEFIQSKNFIKASEMFQNITTLNSLDFEAHLFDGLTFYQTGKYDLAIEKITDAINIKGVTPYLLMVLGILHSCNRNYEKGVFYFKTALKKAPTSNEIIINYSTLLIEQGELTEAQQLAERALRLNNNDHHAWLLRGRCLKNYGNFDDAKQSAESAILLEPKDVSCWLLKGAIALEMVEYQEALQILRQAADIDDSNAAIWYNLGLITLLQGKIETAMEYADRAIKLNPSMFETVMLYAVCHLTAGQRNKYEIIAKKAQMLNPVKYNRYNKIFSLKNNPVHALKALDTLPNPYLLDTTVKCDRYPIFDIFSMRPLI